MRLDGGDTTSGHNNGLLLARKGDGEAAATLRQGWVQHEGPKQNEVPRG